MEQQKEILTMAKNAKTEPKTDTNTNTNPDIVAEKKPVGDNETVLVQTADGSYSAVSPSRRVKIVLGLSAERYATLDDVNDALVGKRSNQYRIAQLEECFPPNMLPKS